MTLFQVSFTQGIQKCHYVRGSMSISRDIADKLHFLRGKNDFRPLFFAVFSLSVLKYTYRMFITSL